MLLTWVAEWARSLAYDHKPTTTNMGSSPDSHLLPTYNIASILTSQFVIIVWTYKLRTFQIRRVSIRVKE